MVRKDDKKSNFFRYYEKKKYPLSNKEKGIKEDQRDLIGKSLDIEKRRSMLFERTL